MVKTVTSENFNETVSSNEITVIDFWAPWCGPCKTLNPIIDAFSKSVNDITIGKVNVDDDDKLASKYMVRSIPTILFLKNGEVVNRKVGIVNGVELAAMVNSLR